MSLSIIGRKAIHNSTLKKKLLIPTMRQFVQKNRELEKKLEQCHYSQLRLEREHDKLEKRHRRDRHLLDMFENLHLKL